MGIKLHVVQGTNLVSCLY